MRDGKSIKSCSPVITSAASKISNLLQVGKTGTARPSILATQKSTRSSPNSSSNRKLVPNYHRLSLLSRHPSKQLNVLKATRHKAKQHQQFKEQQKNSNSKTLSSMVISVSTEGTSPSAPSPVATSKINGNNGETTKPNDNSESEYSSLEDDDDFAAGNYR